jgi:hypothetical protein
MDLSTCLSWSFARSRSGGASVANGFILFVSAGARLKSYMRSEIDLGGVSITTT